MVDQIAQSVRHEMDQRDIGYDMEYPAYCHRLYSSLPVSAKMLEKFESIRNKNWQVPGSFDQSLLTVEI